MIIKNISQDEAYEIGASLNINWNVIDINQFRRGLEVELEHGIIDSNTDVTHNDMLLTGKIALAHLNELGDYYSRLEIIENVKLNVSNNSLGENKFNSSLYTGLLVGAGLMLFGKYLKNKKS